jgi:hypothetical protein
MVQREKNGAETQSLPLSVSLSPFDAFHLFTLDETRESTGRDRERKRERLTKEVEILPSHLSSFFLLRVHLWYNAHNIEFLPMSDGGL